MNIYLFYFNNVKLHVTISVFFLKKLILLFDKDKKL